MTNYNLLETELNEEAKRILSLIKIDYYDKMSDKKKKVIDELLESDKIVIVDKGFCPHGRNIIAHGGRSKGDGKIHYYPDSREYKSDEEMVEECKSILAHEVFHYFIQPDAIEIEDKYKKMASYYTEGLVEKETRKFCARHQEIKYNDANYGHYIKFVNMIQGALDAGSYEVIFSESDYLKNIGRFETVYQKIIKEKYKTIEVLMRLSLKVPKNQRKELFKHAKARFLRDGDIRGVKEGLRREGFFEEADLDMLEDVNNKEL